MKKIFAIIISLALLSTASVTAFAAQLKMEVTPQWLRVLMLREMLQQQFTV